MLYYTGDSHGLATEITTTEEWLDTIEKTATYKVWYCGHWHINKRIEKIHFLFHDFETNEQTQQ